MKQRFIFLISFLTGTVLTLVNCSSENSEDKVEVVYGTPVSYGDEIYGTVVIGKQTWLSRNLNYDPGTGNSWCYNDCYTYGRHYDWATAMALDTNCNGYSCASLIQSKHKGICPPDFHIPTRADWNELVIYAGGIKKGIKKLKSNIGWPSSSYDNTANYGFSALPGGYYNEGFISIGEMGYWWTASEGSYGAIVINMSDEDINDYELFKKWGLSVRCLKD
jgi:uncharacterized protein (TIGR02145 family)